MARNLRVGVQRGLRQSIGGGFGTGDIFTLSPASFDFSRSNTKDSRITFTRASSGTFVGADGLIKTTPVNILRYSEQMNQWIVGNGSSVTANQAVAPDGTNTADRVQHGSGGSSWIRQDILTAGTTYTASVYAKAVTPGASDQFTFDVGGLSSVFTATNEWQRFTFTGTASNASFYLNNGDDSFSTDVYFWGAQVEEGLVATDYIPTTSTISGAPRFDHDLATGKSLGLLIEESRTNIVTYSEQFDQWGPGSNTTVTANAATAPDGTNTADRLQMPASSGTFVGSNNCLIHGRTYTGSVYVKAVTPGTNDQFTLSFGGESPINSTSKFTATGEWQRFEATKTPSLSSATRPFVINNSGDDFVVDIYVWGAQVEEASFATSYISTTSSQVTRAADVVDITGTNFSSFYNQSAGTVFTEYNHAYIETTSSNVYVFNADADNRILSLARSDRQYLGLVETAGVHETEISKNTGWVNNQHYKTAFGVANNNVAMFLDGVQQGSTDTSVTLPTVNTLTIGRKPDSNNRFINGHIKRLSYFPTRLPNATLQSITS